LFALIVYTLEAIDLQAFSKQVASWSMVFPLGLVHVKTTAVFITHVQYLAETLFSCIRCGNASIKASIFPRFRKALIAVDPKI